MYKTAVPTSFDRQQTLPSLLPFTYLEDQEVMRVLLQKYKISTVLKCLSVPRLAHLCPAQPVLPAGPFTDDTYLFTFLVFAGMELNSLPSTFSSRRGPGVDAFELDVLCVQKTREVVMRLQVSLLLR